LKDGPRDIDDIKSTFNISSRLIVPQIKQLEKEKIIIENNGVFQLSNIGELLIDKMLEIMDINILLDKDRGYWEKINLSSLPPQLYERIGDLKNNYLYEYDITNVLEISPPFYPHLVKTTRYFMLLPYFHPNVIRETLNITKNGTETTLIAI
jgi:predicted transcriptional regulator